MTKDKENSEVGTPQEADEVETNFLDYVIVLAKRKELIISITVGLMFVFAVYSLIVSPIYRAETKILPPQQASSSMATQLLNQLWAAGGAIGGVAVIKTPNDLFVALLKSNTVLDKIIERFNFMKTERVKFKSDARKILFGKLKTQDDKKSGIITVGVEDRDPKKSADMANAFIEELKSLNKGLAITEASQRRLFFQEQLEDEKKALARSEDEMKGFQEKTGVVKIEEQTKAMIESIAHLRALIASRVVELKVMRTYSTEENPDVKKSEEAIREMRIELSELESKSGTGYDPLMPAGRIPEVGTEYIRKLRDLKFNETLYELLLKQYEAAKLDEAKDAAIIQVVDKAEPPEKKVKPQRMQMVIIAGLVGFFFSIFIAFFMEYMEKSSLDPENRERMNSLKEYFRFDRTRYGQYVKSIKGKIQSGTKR